MTASIYIQNAATVIRDIDPSLAELFLAEPFRRRPIIQAFDMSLRNSFYEPVADRITCFLNSMVDKDVAQWAHAD